MFLFNFVNAKKEFDCYGNILPLLLPLQIALFTSMFLSFYPYSFIFFTFSTITMQLQATEINKMHKQSHCPSDISSLKY